MYLDASLIKLKLSNDVAKYCNLGTMGLSEFGIGIVCIVVVLCIFCMWLDYHTYNIRQVISLAHIEKNQASIDTNELETKTNLDTNNT